MPRSRSRSLLSRISSPAFWFSRKRLPAKSILSTTVVLPWSTCAMIAMFLIFCIYVGVAMETLSRLSLQSYAEFFIPRVLLRKKEPRFVLPYFLFVFLGYGGMPANISRPDANNPPGVPSCSNSELIGTCILYCPLRMNHILYLSSRSLSIFQSYHPTES